MDSAVTIPTSCVVCGAILFLQAGHSACKIHRRLRRVYVDNVMNEFCEGLVQEMGT